MNHPLNGECHQLNNILFYALNNESLKRYLQPFQRGMIPNLYLTHIQEIPISVPYFRIKEKIIGLIQFL